jgi:predicted RNA binding protein YcfA (HicA-like mRNA interferase family)
MSEQEKILFRILRGTSDTNIPFDHMCNLLLSLGFQERIRGSHHIFSKDGVEDILNLQPKAGGRAKPYQVKQVRQVLMRYRLGGREENGK